MSGPAFDADDVFDADYLHFYGPRLEEASDADTGGSRTGWPSEARR